MLASCTSLRIPLTPLRECPFVCVCLLAVSGSAPYRPHRVLNKLSWRVQDILGRWKRRRKRAQRESDEAARPVASSTLSNTVLSCQTETQAYFLQVYFAVRRHARCRGARAPNVHAPAAPPEDYPVSTTCSLSGRCSHGFRRPLTPNGRRIPASPQPPNNIAHVQSKKNSQSEALLARHPTMEYIHIHHIIHMPV